MKTGNYSARKITTAMETRQNNITTKSVLYVFNVLESLAKAPG